MSDDERLVVSVPEAARLLGISRTHAYELIARGELPSIRLGRFGITSKVSSAASMTTRNQRRKRS